MKHHTRAFLFLEFVNGLNSRNLVYHSLGMDLVTAAEAAEEKSGGDRSLKSCKKIGTIESCWTLQQREPKEAHHRS